MQPGLSYRVSPRGAVLRPCCCRAKCTSCAGGGFNQCLTSPITSRSAASPWVSHWHLHIGEISSCSSSPSPHPQPLTVWGGGDEVPPTQDQQGPDGGTSACQRGQPTYSMGPEAHLGAGCRVEWKKSQHDPNHSQMHDACTGVSVGPHCHGPEVGQRGGVAAIDSREIGVQAWTAATAAHSNCRGWW